jgi:hypothetical protein
MRVALLSIYAILFTTTGYTQDTIQLKTYISNLKKVEVVIKGQSYSFLFDTGGGETFISPEIAKKLNKEVYGNETSFRMHGEMFNYAKTDSVTLHVGKTVIFHSTLGVWDIMSILPEGLPKIDGVLSLKSFRDKIVTLDFPSSKLVIETKPSFQKQQGKLNLLQSRFASGMNGNELTIFLNIPYKNRSYWFLFDSGNLNDLLFSHHTAHEWKLQGDSTEERKELGFIKVRIGKKIMETTAASERIIYNGALNYSLISKSRYIINFPQKQVWMF